ncbi:MAG: hypothetical protein QNK20_01955 [Aureibaculum sp.]|nr:hypothetical protein [Aureibaculum sp.]
MAFSFWPPTQEDFMLTPSFVINYNWTCPAVPEIVNGEMELQSTALSMEFRE